MLLGSLDFPDLVGGTYQALIIGENGSNWQGWLRGVQLGNCLRIVLYVTIIVLQALEEVLGARQVLVEQHQQLSLSIESEITVTKSSEEFSSLNLLKSWISICCLPTLAKKESTKSDSS